MTPSINVVVAVIGRPDGPVLLARRAGNRPMAGWWEFPGGKVEAGEALEQALARELAEELGIDVLEAWPWLVREHAYDHARVRLHFFRVTRFAGEPHGREGQELAWQAPGAVGATPLLPANGPVLDALRLPPCYAISHAAAWGVDSFLHRFEARLADGLRLVLLREPDLSPGERDRLGRCMAEALAAVGGQLMVHEDADLACQLGAGLHLPARRLMALDRRPERPGLLAASCHDSAELAHAAGLGLDFVVLSPVAVTRSHPQATPLGWARFGALCQGQPMPVYALGGLSAADLDTARRHGGHGVAGIRGFFA